MMGFHDKWPCTVTAALNAPAVWFWFQDELRVRVSITDVSRTFII